VKVCLCVPSYGSQVGDWWAPLIQQAADLYKNDIDLVAVQAVGGMAADIARNRLARDFLTTDAEWSWWVDADNIHQPGTLKRLLDTATNRQMVTGVYVKRIGEPEPIAYLRLPDGRYETLGNFRRGEIVPVDAAGMGACLIHRSVFEAFDDNYITLMRASGGNVAIHKDDIQGDIFESAENDTDGKVVDGVLQERLYFPPDPVKVPFFALEYGRTEDYWFFERTKRMGIQLWCDTGVEVGHIGQDIKRPASFQTWQRSLK